MGPVSPCRRMPGLTALRRATSPPERLSDLLDDVSQVGGLLGSPILSRPPRKPYGLLSVWPQRAPKRHRPATPTTRWTPPLAPCRKTGHQVAGFSRERKKGADHP